MFEFTILKWKENVIRESEKISLKKKILEIYV